MPLPFMTHRLVHPAQSRQVLSPGHVLVRNIAPRHVCHVTSGNNTQRLAMSRHASLRHVKSNHKSRTKPCRLKFKSYQVMSCQVIPRHIASCHVMSCHVMSCHVMSCHVMSCHVITTTLLFLDPSSWHRTKTPPHFTSLPPSDKHLQVFGGGEGCGCHPMERITDLTTTCSSVE